MIKLLKIFFKKKKPVFCEDCQYLIKEKGINLFGDKTTFFYCIYKKNIKIKNNYLKKYLYFQKNPYELNDNNKCKFYEKKTDGKQALEYFSKIKKMY